MTRAAGDREWRPRLTIADDDIAADDRSRSRGQPDQATNALSFIDSPKPLMTLLTSSQCGNSFIRPSHALTLGYFDRS